MSEQANNNGSKLRNDAMKIGAAVLIGGLAGAGATEALSSSSSTPAESHTATATVQVENDLALGHSEDVLKGGTAVVQMKNGSQINITSPIIARNGAAVERTSGSDAGENSAVTAYSPGENGVKSVSYFDNKAGLNPDGFSPVKDAQAVTTPIQLERAPGLSGDGVADSTDNGANYLVPASGEPNAVPGEHIAQGTEYNG